MIDKTPKLIAFDLDGTLTESKQPLSHEMGELIEKLLLLVPVAVLSGAGFPQFEKQFLGSLSNEAKISNLYLFPDNAAQCLVYTNGSWRLLYDNTFTTAERENILQALDEALKITGLAEEPEKVWGERVEDRGAQITFSGLGQKAPLADKIRWDPKREKRNALRLAITKHLPEFSVATGGLTSVDITKKGISKAFGIQKLSELTGTAISDMIYVGDALEDGGNDEVVKKTGVKTYSVKTQDNTANFIKLILSV